MVHKSKQAIKPCLPNKKEPTVVISKDTVHEQNNKSLSESDITEEQLQEVILSFDSLKITYDFSTFKVLEISK